MNSSRQNRLKIFISSTGDLKKWRATVSAALHDLYIDDSLFEDWSSSPNSAIEECYRRIEESDGVVLLLGKKYGSIIEEGLSATHLEFIHADKLGKPIFAFKVHKKDFQKEQMDFISFVESKIFRCKPIGSLEILREEIKLSFYNEFVRCFRDVHSPSRKASSLLIDEEKSIVSIPNDTENAFKVLYELYQNGQNIEVYSEIDFILSNFRGTKDILNIAYMSAVNLALDGYEVRSEILIDADIFWSNKSLEKKWQVSSIRYCQPRSFQFVSQN